MTRHFSIAVLGLLVLLGQPPAVSAWTGTVVKVIDGDSLVVRGKDDTVEIRLYGIDTPEYRQPYSNKAKQLSRRLVLRKRVGVKRLDKDRYGRTVAIITVGDTTLNRELVSSGLAWYYARYCRRQPFCSTLKKQERLARKRRAGLWRDPDPVAPWDWKRLQRESGNRSGSGRFSRFLQR